MPKVIRHNYEVSSEGAVRHWEIPYARLSDPLPIPTIPEKVLGLLPGSELTGTVLTIDPDTSVAVIDFTCSMVYLHEVRNVLTYNAGAGATWGPINIGDPVYFDDSATMPAGTYLSTSPLNNLGTANPLFGRVVPYPVESDVFPKGAALVGSTHDCSVMQVGAGAA